MRSTVIALTISFFFTITGSIDEPISSMRFRNSMHEIYKNYRGIYISTTEANLDAAQAHVNLMRSHIDNLYPIIPDHNADGGLINKGLFKSSLKKLGETLDELDDAILAGDSKKAAKLPGKILSICSGCHSQAKLKYIFRLPKGQKLIGEYMHSVAENYEMAKIYFESGEREEAKDHLFIVNEYLSLLKRIFPDQSPSGVIMSRDRLQAQITEVERLNETLQDKLGRKKVADFDNVMESVNSICLSCHDPETIR